MMKCLLYSAIFLLLLNACSVYRSVGRKQFEAAAPGKIKTAAFYQPQQCTYSDLESAEVTGDSFFNQHELIKATPDFEIWRRFSDSIIEIKVLQKTEKTVYLCVYEFVDEKSWNLHQQRFIDDVESRIIALNWENL